MNRQVVSTAVVAMFVAVVLSGCSAARSIPGGTMIAPEAPGVASSEQTKASSGASAPGSAGGVSTDTAAPVVVSPRQIVRTGSADLEVRSVTDAFATVQQIAASVNGSVASSSFAGSSSNQSASLTLRVPGDRFYEVVAKLRDVAVEVRSITTGSNDVTDEYADVQATIANLRAVEAQYMQLLARASSIIEVLQVQDRLNQTRLQIDRTEARRQSLASQVAMSTITVSLRPVSGIVANGSTAGRVQVAWRASLTTLSVIGTVALVTVVYLWWLLPPALGIAAVMVWRRRRRVAVPPAEVQS